MLCCYSYSNPALAYTQQYNVGDTGPNGGTVTSSTLTSVITNTEVTLNGGFEDTTTTTNWTETVVEEIATSTTTEPLFIDFIISFETIFGASAPGINTPPTNKSHSEISFFKSVLSLSVGIILSPNCL